MNNLLHIDASAQANGSHFRQLGDYFQQQWFLTNPSDQIVTRDLVIQPVEQICQTITIGFFIATANFLLPYLRFLVGCPGNDHIDCAFVERLSTP